MTTSDIAAVSVSGNVTIENPITEWSMHFTGRDGKPALTIRPDGTMELGEGLSADEVTQYVAALLADNYSKLHHDQLQEIGKLKAQLREFYQRK